MKSFIIIISLLVFTEIQFSLCSKIKDDTFPTGELIQDPNEVELNLSDQKGLEDADPKMIESVESDENPLSPYPVVSTNQENISRKSFIIPDKTEKNARIKVTNVDEIKRRATARRDDAIENSKAALQRVKKDIETLLKDAKMERKEAFKKIDEQYKEAVSVVAAIGRRAAKKYYEASENAEKECDQAKLIAEEKFNKATEQYNAALEAADEEFEVARSKIKENKRQVERQHQEVLERARNEKDFALDLAKGRLDQNQKNNRKAKRRIMRTAPKEAQNFDNEYQEELHKYDEAVLLAEDGWQKVLDDLGIGYQYDAAEEEAARKLELAQEKAGSMLQGLSEEREKAFQKAETKKQEAIRLAKAARSEAEDECKEIRDKADKNEALASKKIHVKWRNVQARANEELKKANAEFLRAENAAINEYENSLRMAAEEEKKFKNMRPRK